MLRFQHEESVDIVYRVPDGDEFLEGEGAVEGEEEVGAIGGGAAVDFDVLRAAVFQGGEDVAAERRSAL